MQPVPGLQLHDVSKIHRLLAAQEIFIREQHPRNLNVSTSPRTPELELLCTFNEPAESYDPRASCTSEQPYE